MPKEPLSINTQTGFSIIETLLAGAIFSLLVTALTGVYLYGEEATRLAGNRARAVLLAAEGLEAVQNIRDANFSNLTNGQHGLAISGGQWIFSGGQDLTDVFTRQITITQLDADRKTITSNVTWPQNLQRTGSATLTSRLTFWQKVVSVISDWTDPNTLAGTLGLDANNDGLKIQVQGNYVYLIRAGGDPNFAVIDISNPAFPQPAVSLLLNGNPTNLAVSGNYAYVSNRNDAEELQVIDISTPASSYVAGTYNAPGVADALGVYAIGTAVYLVRASSPSNEFIIVDESNPASPQPVGSLNLSASGNEVAVVGNYAYVAGNNGTQELQVINITTPSSPGLAGSLNLPSAATTIAAFGTIVVIGHGTTLSLTSVANSSAPTPPANYAAGGTVNDISLGLSNTYAFLATNNTTNDLQVVNISNPSSLTYVGGFNVPAATFNGVAYDANSDRAFIASTSNSAELSVIAP